MKQEFITRHSGNRRLILIFLGWGMTDAVLNSVERLDGYDIMAVWDYRDESFDAEIINSYREIFVFAWSFGVFMAARTLARNSSLPVALKVAINGTLNPVHDTLGIPSAIFHGTLAGLNERSLAKFYRRMCSDISQFNEFKGNYPERDIDGLKDELTAIERYAADGSPLDTSWHRVIIAADDRIFPPENMAKAWEHTPRTSKIAGGHLPQWQKILESEIINKKAVGEKFESSASTYDENAIVQNRIAATLWKLWRENMTSQPCSILEIGAGTGMLTIEYAPVLTDADITTWDLTNAIRPLPTGKAVTGDAEELVYDALPDSFDTIVSASTFQWFNSLPMFLNNASRIMRRGGILAFSTFGHDNMKELSAITGSSLRYFSKQELCDMIPEGFEICEALEERITMYFNSPRDILVHLRDTGVNGVYTPSNNLARIMHEYPRHDEGCPLTYHPIYIIARKK